MSCWMLYWMFARISLLTFGGGYAMVPLYQDELVIRNAFMTAEEFANLVAMAQMTPGPMGLNAATYIGYQQAGFWGAAAGTLGVLTPCILVATAAACFLHKMSDHPFVSSLLGGIRPVVLGIILSSVVFFANTSIFTAPLDSLWKGKPIGICWPGMLIFALTFVIYRKWKPNLLWLFLGAGILGWLLLP